MKAFGLIAASFLALAINAGAQEWKLSDPEATPEAQALYARLQRIQAKGTMYGHQDDLMTGRTWRYEPDRSDVLETVGDYPGVAGFELGELELGGPESLDGVNFTNMTERVRWWHKRGGIITISWHCVNPISSQWPGIKEPNGAGSAWEVDFLAADGDNAVRNVLPGGRDHAMFNSWLDRVARLFNYWRDDEGKLIPFMFRPYHEHSGSFFWWGRDRCYDEEYAALYRYTADYLKAKGLHNIIWMYNTDKVYSEAEYLRGYPGDDYVDMLSIDWYGSGEEFNRNIKNALDFTTKLAEEKHKLHALSECGPLSEDLQKILSGYKSTYVLTWRNAPMSPRPAVPGAPPVVASPARNGASAAAPRRSNGPSNEDLLKMMKANKNYLFHEDVKKIK